MIIDLLWCEGQHVILCDESAPEITTQADGCCCSQPSMKGILIPLPRTFDGLKWVSDDIFDASKNYLSFPQDGAYEKYENCLVDNGFANAKILGGTEAWLHFQFNSRDGTIKKCVLTWKNSD